MPLWIIVQYPWRIWRWSGLTYQNKYRTTHFSLYMGSLIQLYNELLELVHFVILFIVIITFLSSYFPFSQRFCHLCFPVSPLPPLYTVSSPPPLRLLVLSFYFTLYLPSSPLFLLSLSSSLAVTISFHSLYSRTPFLSFSLFFRRERFFQFKWM